MDSTPFGKVLNGDNVNNMTSSKEEDSSSSKKRFHQS